MPSRIEIRQCGNVTFFEELTTKKQKKKGKKGKCNFENPTRTNRIRRLYVNRTIFVWVFVIVSNDKHDVDFAEKFSKFDRTNVFKISVVLNSPLCRLYDKHWICAIITVIGFCSGFFR